MFIPLLKKSFTFTYPCPRKLREIAKLSLFEREKPDHIKTIWEEYHVNKPGRVVTVLDATLYSKFKRKYFLYLSSANESPMSMYPVKRKGGHFVLLAQCQTNSIV